MNLILPKELIKERGIMKCVDIAMKHAKKRYAERIKLIKEKDEDMEISIEIRPRYKDGFEHLL